MSKRLATDRSTRITRAGVNQQLLFLLALSPERVGETSSRVSHDRQFAYWPEPRIPWPAFWLPRLLRIFIAATGVLVLMFGVVRHSGRRVGAEIAPQPLPGRTMARTGLRMMPTSPWPP
jgi:hypothetical protein